MCGIAGITGRHNEALVNAMLDRIAHRGPDGRGVDTVSSPAAVLGSVRLAIMDPAHGRQPIWNEDRTLAVVCNGEIYNAPELRAALQARGHNFSTGSDSEVLVHLFEDHGPDLLPHLHGMYAFAIAGRGQFVAGRDPVGIKPLYYAEPGRGQFAFASEQCAFIGTGLHFRTFPPGHVWTPGGGFQRQLSIPYPNPTDASPDEFAGRIRQTIEAATRRCLMSDVGVGVFLSGGLDSSLIAAIAARHARPVYSFSVGHPGSPDLAAARTVAQTLGLIHHEYEMSVEEAIRDLPDIVRHSESYDERLVVNCIPTWYCSRLAAKHGVKVVLTGEGADELFAGYSWYDSFDQQGLLDRALHGTLSTLHGSNCQRLDRMAMAHGVEARVPFLERDMVQLGMEIPARLKLMKTDGAEPVEKWILRKAAEGVLPDEIVWRKKAAFAVGAGTVDVGRQIIEPYAQGLDAPAYRRRQRKLELHGTQEVVFHNLLTRAFGPDSPLYEQVERPTKSRRGWQPQPPKGILQRLLARFRNSGS